jgi:hypothetical protein
MATTFTPEQSKVSKQVQRMRVYAVFFLAAFGATIFTLTEENDIFLHALDDYVLIALSVIALVIFAMKHKDEALGSLKRTNNILLILAVIELLAVVFAFSQEINDPSDFGNDPGQLFLALALIVNRFV